MNKTPIKIDLDTCFLSSILKYQKIAEINNKSVKEMYQILNQEYARAVNFLRSKYGKYMTSNIINLHEVKSNIYNSNPKLIDTFKADCKSIRFSDNSVSGFKINLRDKEVGIDFKEIENALCAYTALVGKETGKYEFYAVDMVICELEGIFNFKNASENILKMSRQEVYSCLGKLVHIDVFDESTYQLTEALASEYRNEKKKKLDCFQKPMPNTKEEIGYLGLMADSYVYARSNLMGRIFVTNNGKDYVFDRDRNGRNEDVRNYIKEVNKNFKFKIKGQKAPIYPATDAVPYTIQEFFLEEKFVLPKKPSMLTSRPIQRTFESGTIINPLVKYGEGIFDVSLQ